ncbi:sulfatase-like hydrolase/transferase [Stratiformator vulcanicus]|uniref:Arylsulfatase n=1 Tax=Stratiformator vulcanicus TaxID=2527980 RepID=A0A517R544_9PLAN|nr:sulfatase-like hydrolase/transferase [Stratiformator vulcanicus]QDT39011.1 Arylsulfatase [Stratiformator vulcanicus]
MSTMSRFRLFFSILLAVSASHLSIADDRPNFVLLFADDLGAETLGCYGGLEFETPELDRMAAEGVRFSRAYTSPVCTPSRMTLLTGQYTNRHGYDAVLPVHLGTRKMVDFKKRFRTIAHELRETGYETSVAGKWQLATLEFHPDHPRTAGFDDWCLWQIWQKGRKTIRYWKPCLNRNGEIIKSTEQDFGPDRLADYVIDRMKSANEAGKPFYMHHNMFLPHLPLVETPDDRAAGRKKSLGNMITYMDKLVGRIRSAVPELGIEDNTYVIFIGDNGTDLNRPRQTKAGPVLGGKRDLDCGGMHVPLIVQCPRKAHAGKVVDRLVDLADYYPTIAELADVSIRSDAALDGQSFADWLASSPGTERDFITGGIKGDFCLFDGEWRLHRQSNQFVDCRNLPNESPADLSDPAAKTAYDRLSKLLESIEPNRN